MNSKTPNIPCGNFIIYNSMMREVEMWETKGGGLAG